MSTEPALFRFDSRFASSFPHRAILAGPTPVQPLERLAAVAGGPDLWIKRDDLTSPLYGGNKPRKLEFLLGAALARGARGLVTFGVLGSHHALATAIHGAEAGLPTTAVLVPGPLHPHALENLKRTCARADDTLLLDWARLPRVAGAVLPAVFGNSERPYLIPPGGSSAIGSLGYVSAALEVAEQVRAGAMPRPDYVFVPAGSLGTLSGLVVGFALAGLDTWVVGIAVMGPPSVTAGRAASLVRRVRVRLIEAAPELKRVRSGFERFSVFFGSLGRGYGHETDAGRAAAARMAELEGITLDTTYTAKTVAGLLEWADRPKLAGKTVLYWHTLSSAAASDDPGALSRRALHPPLDRILRDAPAPLDQDRRDAARASRR